jgi:hypothetical protein
MKSTASTPVRDHPMDFNGSLHDAVELVEDKAQQAASATQGFIRSHPLATIGAGVASGVILGAIGQRMFDSRRPVSIYQRLGVIAGLGSAIAGLTRLSRRLVR